MTLEVCDKDCSRKDNGIGTVETCPKEGGKFRLAEKPRNSKCRPRSSGNEPCLVGISAFMYNINV